MLGGFSRSPLHSHSGDPNIPIDIPQLSPLENTEIGTALIHHVNGKLSWSSLVIIYMCKKVSNTSVIRSLIHPFIFTPPPPTMIYIINEFLKYYSIDYHFFKILHTHYLQCKEIPKAVTKITFWHKVNFSLQNIVILSRMLPQKTRKGYNVFFILAVKECNMTKLVKLLCLPLENM